MTIEEKVKQNPEALLVLVNNKKEDFRFAFKSLSQTLDNIIGAIMNEYASKENVEFNLNDVKDYKELNKLIEKKLDQMMKEYLIDIKKIPA